MKGRTASLTRSRRRQTKKGLSLSLFSSLHGKSWSDSIVIQREIISGKNELAEASG